MTDPELMQAIKTNLGAQIDNAAASCSVPAAFFAALIANESAGDPHAKRFEKNVLASLWQVLMGRAPAYGSISSGDLAAFVGTLSQRVDAFQRLDALATSWGITQIMGYEAIPFRLASDASLEDPETALHVTTLMLADFAHRNQLDVTRDFSQMFDCWNTGRPHAQTFDPKYIPNGLARMALWPND